MKNTNVCHLIALLFSLAVLSSAADDRKSAAAAPSGKLHQAEVALKACHLDCKKEADNTTYETCMVTCNKTYPQVAKSKRKTQNTDRKP
jgi:hypothetical protein